MRNTLMMPNTGDRPMTTTTRKKMADLLTAENARDRFPFVADYVSLITASKDGEEMAQGYRVKQVKGGYEMTFGGLPMFATMTAEQVNEWCERTPLRSFAMEAEGLRYDLLTA
jgi:hypothetical protein